LETVIEAALTLCGIEDVILLKEARADIRIIGYRKALI